MDKSVLEGIMTVIKEENTAKKWDTQERKEVWKKELSEQKDLKYKMKGIEQLFQ